MIPIANCLGNAGQRFIANESTRRDIAALQRNAKSFYAAGLMRGKTVLLALEQQLDTIEALLALDGVARRIILWPRDQPRDHVEAVLPLADVDVVVATWPPENALGSTLAIEADMQSAPAYEVSPVATEWVLFTSGTTGKPKMVVHTLESLAGHLLKPSRVESGPVWCTFYDIRRYGGLQIALRALLGGGSLLLSCPDETPAAFLTRAAAFGASHFLGTPSHWRRALMTDAIRAISPQYIRLSGEVADQIILDQLRGTYPSAKIVHAFASTEAGLAFEVSDGLAGFPASFVGVSSSGLADIQVKNGSLQIRSARNATGYLDSQIRSIADRDGMVDTGDIVELRNGRYYFIGRQDGIVNVGGQKVHPEEVEAVINQHPDVQMSLVTGRSSPITGAIVVADVVFRSGCGHSVSPPSATRRVAAEIQALCREALPPHKVPVSIRFVPSLGIATTGKLVRRNA